MRPLTVNLWANNGTSTPGALKVVSGQIFELADLAQEVDGSNALTKVTPATLTAKVGDPDGSIWTFIQDNLALLDGSGAQLGILPPWMELYAGTKRLFVGMGDLPSFTQVWQADDYSIEFKAYDWSMALSTTYLGAPTAPPYQKNHVYQLGQQVLNGNAVYQCLQAGTSGSGGGPTGIATGILWIGSVYYTVGAQVINAGNCYICATPGTSASSGGPTTTGSGIADGSSGLTWNYTGAAIVDGTVIWAWVPPSWQRPVPTIAINPQAVTAVGESQGYAYMMGGYNLSTIFFPDPQAGFTPGQTLNMSTPALYYVPRTGVGCPTIGSGPGEVGLGATATDIDGQTCTVEVVGTGHEGGDIFGWVATTPWSTPVGCPSMTLPSSQWPAGFLIANSSGSLWVVSADGTTWNSIAAADVPMWGIHPTVISLQDNFMYGLGPGTLATPTPIPYLYMTVQPNPWPAVSGVPSNPYLGNFKSTITLANATAQDIHYWVTTVPFPTSPASGSPTYWLDLNSVAGIVAGDTLQVIDAPFSWSGKVAGVDPILSRVCFTEALSTAIPVGTHIYWDAESQLDMVMEDPRNLLVKAVQPFSVDTTSQFSQPVTADPVFGFLPLHLANSDFLWPIGDLEPTLTEILLSTGAVWTNPANGQPLTTYTWTGDADGGWTGPTPVTTAPAPNADWTRQLVSAPSSLMPYEVVQANPFQRVRNRPYSDVSYYRENNGLIQVQIGSTYYLVNGDYVFTNTEAGSSWVINYSYEQNGTTYTTASANFTLWSAAWAPWAGPFVSYDYQSMVKLAISGGSVNVYSWSGTAWGTPTTYTWPGSRYLQDAVPLIGVPGTTIALTVDSSVATTNPKLEVWDYHAASATTLALTGANSAFIGGQLTTTPYGVFIVAGPCIGQISCSGVGGAITIQPLYLTDQVNWLWANTLVARTASEIVILGRYDDLSSGSTVTSTYLFRLILPFVTSLDANTLLAEKIIDGAPPTIGAMRDITKPGRVIGHMGGSLWQLDTVRSWCVARVRPTGMTAMELIEHIAQAFCAIAIPNVATGVMQMVSRLNNAYPTSISPDQVSIKNTANWKEFSTIIRISANNDPSIYWDAVGQQGGGKLEMDQHPLCYSFSDCMALAESWQPWFGVPRLETNQEWFFTDSNSAPPWEGLQMFSPLLVNGGTTPMVLMKLSQNVVKGSATVKLLQGQSYTLPGVDYSDPGHQWIYNLAVNLTSYPTTYTAEVQRRDLLDTVHTSFATYAKIPTSMLNTVGLGLQSTQQPKDLFGMQITSDGKIYLSFNPSAYGSFATTSNRNSIATAQMYLLTAVDGSQNGTWTLMASNTNPYVYSGTVMTGPGGSWGAEDTPPQYANGINVLSNATTSVTYYNDAETATQLLTACMWMSPYYLSNGLPTHSKPVSTEQDQKVLHAGYDNLAQNYHGTVKDTLGNFCDLEPTQTTYTMYDVYAIATGSLLQNTSITFAAPYTFSTTSKFAVVFTNLLTWNGVTCNSAFGTPTTTIPVYIDNTGAIIPLTLPTSNGNDVLVGVLGNNQVGIYRKYLGANQPQPLHSQENYYLKKPGSASQFSIYSVLEPSGSLVHLEGVTTATPALYRDDVKILDLA
jgi:hypothetical protein